MKKLLLSFILMMTSLSAIAGIPTVQITAPTMLMKVGDITTLTFTFSEAVTGFDLTDVHILGDGQFTTALTPVTNSPNYTVGFQKLVNNFELAIVIDNKSFTDTATGANFGVGNTIGFNPIPRIYIKAGNAYNGILTVANPQPVCPRVGQYLVDNVGAPSTPVIEKYYTVKGSDYHSTTDVSQGLREIPQGCLVRLLNGQKFVEKPVQSAREIANVHSGHSNGSLNPKINQYQLIPKAGFSKPRVKASDKSGCNTNVNPITCDGTGDFREGLASFRLDADDPIVFPGLQGKGHLHTFFGNTNINYQSNSSTVGKGCTSLADGGSINCTGYWMPSIVDLATNTPLLPDGVQIYYKALLGAYNGHPEYARLIEPIPKGLRLVVGNPAAQTAAAHTDATAYFCTPRDGSTAPNIESVYIMPSCSGHDYSYMRVSVDFPSCLKDDPANPGSILLDSTNHRSHLVPSDYDPTASLYGVVQPNGCPAQYPHSIISIGQKVDYILKEGMDTKTWRLSSDNYSTSLQAGASLHADYFAGWQDYWALRMVTNCGRLHVNCGNNYLGISDPRKISSIVTTVTAGVATATVTTTLPHFLNIGEPADYVGAKVRISGVGGVNASIYNFNPAQVALDPALDPAGSFKPFTTQVTGGLSRGGPTNTFTYVLPSVPTDLNPSVTNANYQVPETLCSPDEDDSSCPQAYSNAWYSGVN